MKIEVSVPEVVRIFKEIHTQPEQLFDIIRADIRQSVGQYLSEMMQVELTRFLGREPYERANDESNHRNGSYHRQFTLKGIGAVDVQVPRDRTGDLQTQVVPRSKRYEDQLRQDLCVMFLTGISTRTLSMLSKRLIGRSVSPTEVSRAHRELINAVEQWRSRDVSQERIQYIFVDGVNFDRRLGDTIEKVPVLVAIGGSETGHRLVLGLQAGDKESATAWREFCKDLKRRGLQSQPVTAMPDGFWSKALGPLALPPRSVATCTCGSKHRPQSSRTSGGKPRSGAVHAPGDLLHEGSTAMWFLSLWPVS